MPVNSIPNFHGIKPLLNPPNSNNLSKNNKRWHFAFVAIYCFGAFLLPFRQHTCKQIQNPENFPTSSPFVVIDLTSDKNPSFSIDKQSPIDIVKKKNPELLRKHGQHEGIASALRTDPENGITGEDNDIIRHREAFGLNTCNKPPSRGLFHFVVESFKDLTTLILVVCAALSLGFGIKEHGRKEGWYDGGNILFAVFIVIAISCIGNYRQSRQFEKLSQVINDLLIEVLRSIFRKTYHFQETGSSISDSNPIS